MTLLQLVVQLCLLGCLRYWYGFAGSVQQLLRCCFGSVIALNEGWLATLTGTCQAMWRRTAHAALWRNACLPPGPAVCKSLCLRVLHVRRNITSRVRVRVRVRV